MGSDAGTKTIVGGALGECVHVAGVLNFFKLAEDEGYRTVFTGPATSVDDLLAAIRRESPEIVAVSYRLTPENARSLLMELGEACSEEGWIGGTSSSGKRRGSGFSPGRHRRACWSPSASQRGSPSARAASCL